MLVDPRCGGKITNPRAHLQRRHMGSQSGVSVPQNVPRTFFENCEAVESAPI
jgi:hypothetical protein